MNSRDQWISELTKTPHDWELALIFADWLDDQGETLEAEQWRYAAQCMSYLPDNSILWLFTQMTTMDRNFYTPRLKTKAGTLEENWAAENGTRFIEYFPFTIQQMHDNQDESIANG